MSLKILSRPVEDGLGLSSSKPKLLIFVVAYFAESTIRSVLCRIPPRLEEEYETEILVIDDGSADQTFERAMETQVAGFVPFPIKVLFNQANQGYGGNQKIGYHYAITNGFDYVVLLHGDGQYAPEFLPDLVRPLKEDGADACFGSRMLVTGSALKGRMPLYKYVGNRILTWFENWMLGTAFSEFHSGYRVYSVQALKRLPFDLNTNDFHFDTEIIIQFVIAGLRIVERPIPTYYGDEISRVQGLRYAREVAKAALKAKIQPLGLLYDRRFDCAPAERANDHYVSKLDFDSPHSFAVARVPAGARVLDLGCAGGYVAAALRREKAAYVAGVDIYPAAPENELDEFHLHDLNRGLPQVDLAEFDYVLLLDVIEHLSSPEKFVAEFRDAASLNPDLTIIVSTGNIAFFVTRFMLFFGQFNYGKRGILDLTHQRLFTFASMRRLFQQGGFRIVEIGAIPAPFALMLGDGRVARVALAVNRFLTRISKRLFAYQILMIIRPFPSLDLLLRRAEEQSAARSDGKLGRAIG